MSEKLKILFIPIDGTGHVNSAIGIAQVLMNEGHKAIFAISPQWKGKLTKYGIEEVIFSIDEYHNNLEEDSAKRWAEVFINGEQMGSNESPLEKVIKFRTTIYPNLINELKKLNPIIEKIIANTGPDVIILDQVFNIPAVNLSGIPWVWTCSANPLFFIEDDRTPPTFSGLAINAKNEWKIFRDMAINKCKECWNLLNEYYVSKGLTPLKQNNYYTPSPFLNIYHFLLEIDYLDIRPLPQNYYRFDNFMRIEKQSDFEIPDELREKSGKLIYFSLGSMGGADVALMKRLVAILAKSKHRFIVSKGPLHDKYELADNMFGQQSVPQIQVLSVVDLVLTHGGNNTVTETFFFGKPMIVMPLFGDQSDNAQRIQETGLGLRLDPYNCTEEELLNGIENLLNDKELNENLKTISKRIQSENSIAKLPKLIENLVNSNKDDFNV